MRSRTSNLRSLLPRHLDRTKYSYDSVGRLASDAVTTLPTGVDGSVRRVDYAYQDDGRASTITTYDAASSGNIVSQVKYTYDGWGNVIEDQESHDGAVTEETPAVIYTYEDGADVSGNAQYVRLSQVTYPSGREIHYCYEAPPTSRLTSISENSGGTQNLVTYTYLGMNTIVKESHPQVSGGLNLSYGSGGTYAGWDRFGQIAQQLWKNDAGTTVDGYTYTYDRAGNRTAKANTLNSAFSETYSYDDLNRLVDANRNGTNLQDWTLDALGNWSGFMDGANSQTRTANAANEVTDVSGSWIDPTYDAAGNMTSGPKAGDETTRLHFVYDAWNHLVAVKADNNGQPGSTIATYAYDGIGRRVSKTVGNDTFDFYYNEQYQVVEVRKNGDTDPYEQYVYDQRYIDAPVMVYRDTNTDGSGIQSVYVIQDANFDVTGIIDGSNATVINRFVYTPYGARTVLTAIWTAATTDFARGHQGLWLDAETGAYDNRSRIYGPTLGTFYQRDSAGYVDGGSLYQCETSSPIQNLDPFGLTVAAVIDPLWGDGTLHGGPWLGHSDFPGGDRFDYTLEDYGWSSPYNPLQFGRHFRYLDDSEWDVSQAIADCNREAFARAMHRGQDFFSHFGRGYRWYTAGHLFAGHEPDNPTTSEGAARWRMAAFWTQQWLDRWDAGCECQVPNAGPPLFAGPGDFFNGMR